LLIIKLWNYIQGYVIILVEGYFPEKFINLCIRKSIFLWDIDRQKSTRIIAKIGIKSFKNLRVISTKTHCKVKIQSKKGIPFLLFRYRKRRVFLAGGVFFICMVYFLSSFVWSVQIVGNKKVQTQVILKSLGQLGIKPGAYKSGVDREKVRSLMMINVKELAWINIDISGTKVIVKVVERVMPPKVIPKNIPCNIVAVKDGIIKELTVKEGTPMVEVGSTVKQGDLLVAGMVESSLKEIRYVHSMASVKARTWYEASAATTFLRKKIIKTGADSKKYSIKFFDKAVSIGNIKPPYITYQLNKLNYLIPIWKNAYLPIGVTVDQYFEQKSVAEKITSGQARQETSQAALDRLTKYIPKNVEIKDKKVSVINDGKTLTTRITAECLEEIAQEERITNDNILQPTEKIQSN
jgi:similar to stage IV sporulation protein